MSRGTELLRRVAQRLGTSLRKGTATIGGQYRRSGSELRGATSRIKTADAHGIGRILKSAALAMGVASLATADSPPDDEQPVVTGLGKEVDALVAMSPTLSEKIRRLQQENWTIDYSIGQGGSYADAVEKVIHIEQKIWITPNDPVEAKRQEELMIEDLTAALAHEVGHATDEENLHFQEPPRGSETKDEWVRRNVESALQREGEAILVEHRVRDEIFENSRNRGSNEFVLLPVTQAPPPNRPRLDTIHQMHENGRISREQARTEIGRIIADSSSPEIASDMTTREYYTDVYENYWNTHYS